MGIDKSNQTDLEQFYSLSQVCAALNLSQSTVRRRLKSGEIQAVKVGKVWRISQTSFQKYVETLTRNKGRA